jgi:hypothetical protein
MSKKTTKKMFVIVLIVGVECALCAERVAQPGGQVQHQPSAGGLQQWRQP